MDEKEFEKREEKTPEEKSFGEKTYEEKHRRDPLGGIVWAVIMIWGGVVFLANNMGVLQNFFQPIIDSLPKITESWDAEIPFDFGAIQIFLLGVAIIFVIEIIIRLIVAEYRRPIFGSAVMIGVVLSLAFDNWDWFFPFLLIAIGVSIIFRKK